MLVDVNVLDAQVRPPLGAEVVVQIRDTAEQDAKAIVLGEARSRVSGVEGPWLATLEVLPRARGRFPTVWAYVDVDGDGRVSRGDFVTTQSHPLSGAQRVQVTVKKV